MPFRPQPPPKYTVRLVKMTPEAFFALPAYETSTPTMSSGPDGQVLGTEIYRRGWRVFRWFEDPDDPKEGLIALSAPVGFPTPSGRHVTPFLHEWYARALRRRMPVGWKDWRARAGTWQRAADYRPSPQYLAQRARGRA